MAIKHTPSQEAFNGANKLGDESAENRAALVIRTIGHSTRLLDEFLRLLSIHGISRVVDVRKMPRSRANPQFNIDTLGAGLNAAGINYTHLPSLGGLRQRQAGSPNTGWRHPSFQGFADYMQTPAFEAGLQELIDLASHESVAILCAEAVPWRCHRSLIADALTARGIRVEHILSAARSSAHELRPWACVRDGKVTYPAPS
jgi:uncharacterized protein (DUF488 family)